jgi:hypothetical protein
MMYSGRPLIAGTPLRPSFPLVRREIFPSEPTRLRVRPQLAGLRLRRTGGLDPVRGARRGRMVVGRHLLSLPVTNGNNGHNLSVRVRQPKAVGFPPRVALDYIRGAGLRGRDGLFLGTQDTGFPLDRNGSLQPIDCEQRALLPLTQRAWRDGDEAGCANYPQRKNSGRRSTRREQLSKNDAEIPLTRGAHISSRLCRRLCWGIFTPLFVNHFTLG